MSRAITPEPAIARPPGTRAPLPRLWQNLWVRLAVALAFADASIVMLALPQLVERLHTSISDVTWVIIAYNLSLIVTSAALALSGRRLRGTPPLVAGLGLFGLASIGCGASNSLSALIPLRCAQGVGGAIVLAASLSLFAGAARPGDSPLHGWSAAAAIGAAIGPAAGGVLTQAFDWRSIFFAQAPVAAIAAVAVLIVRHRAHAEIAGEPDRPPMPLDPLRANAALTLLSAGLIGALFLIVVELINAWLLSPIGAAAVVSALPVSTAAAERLVRGRSPTVLGGVGAVLLSAGLVLLALLTHRQLALVVIGLLLCGTGLGLAYPGLTAAALESGGSPAARAAKTVAARDAGIVIGLLVLTPVFVTQLNGVSATNSVPVQNAAAAVLFAPLPLTMKLELSTRLLVAYKSAGKTTAPNVAPAFDAIRSHASPVERSELDSLQATITGIAQRAVTTAFRWPFIYAAIFALLVLPVLALPSGRLRLGQGSPARKRSARP